LNSCNLVNYYFLNPLELPVIVLYSPQSGPIRPDAGDTYNILITGITTNINQCVFKKLGGTQEFYSTPTVIKNDEVNCPVPTGNINANDYGKWVIIGKNQITGQTSDPKEFVLYPNPMINSISPQFGKSYGGETLEIRGSGFLIQNSTILSSSVKITFRISTIRSSVDCKILNDSFITCVTPPHPEDKAAKISLSYNENNFMVWSGGSYEVKACQPGEYGSNYEQQCTACPAGQYKHKEGFFECIECEEARYQPSKGSIECLKCPVKTTAIQGSKNITDCDCQEGTWRKNGTYSGIDCDDCVYGGICDGKSSLPRPLPGYYWLRTEDAEPFTFLPCNTPAFCTGNTTYGEGCIVGRTGLLCENCANGYFKSSGVCEICNTDVQWRMILVIIALVVLILIFFKFAQLKVSHLSSFSIASEYYQIIAVFSAYNFKWPTALKTVLGYMKFLNLDLDIFVPECISAITYGMKWGATLGIPAIFAILLFIGFILEVIRSLMARIYGKLVKRIFSRFYVINRQNWVTSNFTSVIVSTIDFFAAAKTIKQIGEFGDKCIHTFVIIISFSYVFVVTKASQIFNCTTVKDKLLMDSERSVECYKGDWWLYFPFSVATLITFGLGVIALFGYVLLFKKKIQASKTFNARFRFLFVRFRDERLFWQMIIIVRKLLISTAVIFFSGYPLLVILFSMFVMFSAFILQIHHVPYRRPFHNTMEYIVLLSTEILLFCALLFYVDDFPSSFQKEVIGVACIIIIGASSVGVALLIVLDFILQWFEDKKKAKVQFLQTLEDLNFGGDVEFAEQDMMLAKYGLRRRPNQTTVILGEEGKITGNKDVKTDTNVSQSVQVHLPEKEDSKDQPIVSPTSSQGSIHHERVNSNTGLLPHDEEMNLEDIQFGSQRNTIVNEKIVEVKVDGIAEIPDDEQDQ
jgi:hypothetical protein